MKSKLVLIIVAAVVVVGAVIGIIVYNTNAYTGYSTAFANSTKQTSMEYDTALKATLDGEVTTATGNMKIRDIMTKVNFVNEMTIDGKKITQFTDGEYIYMDDGSNKTKYKIGETPDNQPKGDDKGGFDMDYYIQEFSILLDASKIKDLKINERLNQNIIQNITKTSSGSNSVYEVTLATQLVNEIFDTVIADQFSDESAPKCVLKSFKYTATANSNKLIDKIVYYIDTDVTFPAALTGEASDQTKSMQLELTMKYINPGQPVSFDLPSTDGFGEQR